MILAPDPDPTNLFNGEQIDAFISHHIADERFLHIGSYFVELLVAGNFSLSSLDYLNLDYVEKIYAPINIDNEHGLY